MLTDRYDLAISTSSAAARDAYVEGCDLLLTAYPGVITALDRAIAADPGFALAYVAKARALQMGGDVPAAKEAMAEAKALSAGLSEREAGQIEIFHLLLSGQADAALNLIRVHLAAWPRDVLALSTIASQLGLIGLSGRAGREQELVDVLDRLAPHYGDDWWFNAHHAMALSETSQQDAARPKIERSIAQYPRNAYAAHALGHLHYEMNEHDAASAIQHKFRLMTGLGKKRSVVTDLRASWAWRPAPCRRIRNLHSQSLEVAAWAVTTARSLRKLVMQLFWSREAHILTPGCHGSPAPSCVWVRS